MIVTTFNKKLYREYAYKFIDSYLESGTTIPLHIYVEDGEEYPAFPNVTFHNLFDQDPECHAFVKRNQHKKAPTYMKDGVRFCYKVFAQCLGSQIDKEPMLWVDADCVFLQKIEERWVSEVLGGKFVAFYSRPGLYTECGFMAYDLSKPCSEGFFEHFRNFYVNDVIYRLENYTDCHAFDSCRRISRHTLGYSERPLGQFATHRKLHVMALDPLIAKHIDHRKGNRKQKEKSPELLK